MSTTTVTGATIGVEPVGPEHQHWLGAQRATWVICRRRDGRLVQVFNSIGTRAELEERAQQIAPTWSATYVVTVAPLALSAANYFTVRNRHLAEQYGMSPEKLTRWTASMVGNQLVNACLTIGRLTVLVAELAATHDGCTVDGCPLCLGIRDMLTALVAHDETSEARR